jgi:predicted flap endonuclease-1-like 5' DNA nuclease
MSSYLESSLYLLIGLALGVIIAILRARSWKEEIRELDEQIEKNLSIETKNKEQIKNLNARLEESQTNSENLRDQLKTMAQNLQKYNNQIKEKEQTIDQKDEKLQTRDGKIEELTTQIMERDQSNKQMNTELQTRATVIQQQSTQLVEAKEQKVELESTLSEKEQEIDKLKARIGAMQDNFTIIAGIGPKVAAILRNSKINTFTQLSNISVDKINEILEKANPNLLRLVDPTTWPEQAKHAVNGEWDALTSRSRES